MKQDTQGTADTGRLLAKKIRTSTPTKTCDDGGIKGEKGGRMREEEREGEREGRGRGGRKEEKRREEDIGKCKDKPESENQRQYA